MTQVLAATTGLFRDRDLFVHDGSKLRRFRISAPLQAVFFVVLLGLVAWASYATARLLTRPHGAIQNLTLPAATEARARMIERAKEVTEPTPMLRSNSPGVLGALRMRGSAPFGMGGAGT